MSPTSARRLPDHRAFSRNSVLLVLALAFQACLTIREPEFDVPKNIDRAQRTFSGAYCFQTVAKSTRTTSGMVYVSFLPLWQLESYSLVELKQEPAGSIVFRFRTKTGVSENRLDLSRGTTTWHRGVLRHTRPSVKEPDGYTRRSFVLYRRADGRLVLQERNDYKDYRPLVLMMPPEKQVRVDEVELLPAGKGGTCDSLDRSASMIWAISDVFRPAGPAGPDRGSAPRG